MREGSVFRRCTLCGSAVDGQTFTCAQGHKSSRTGSSRTFAWAFVVDISRPGATKRRQRRAGGFTTADEAREAMARLQVGVEDGTLMDPSALRVGEWLDSWLAGVQVKPSTRDSYELHVRRRLKPYIGDMRLQHLRPSDVRALYVMLKAGGGQGGRSLSAKTVHNVHLCLRVALARAVKDQLIPSNPADSAHKLPDAPEMQYWTPAQLRAFLDHVAGDRLFALWRLAATTGMRRGELLGLQWRDLDLDSGVLVVRRQWAKSNGTVSIMTLKGRQGATKTRRVDLDASTVAALRHHSAHQLDDRAHHFLGRRPEDAPMFDLPDGTPIDPDGLTQRFARHVKSSGLPRIRLHDLRHSSATAALTAGVHPKIVQERLGHASVTTTMNTYSHALPTLQAAAADQIANAIDL